MIGKTLITTIAVASSASVAWTAESGPAAHEQERAGLASGAVLGGLAGGPLGLVFGAALGGWIGDEFDTQRGERDVYERQWREAQAAVADLNGLLDGKEQEVGQLTADYRRETAAMRERLRDALDVQVLFKTGVSELAEGTSRRLERLAELVADMDGTLLQIEGHADARGDADFNEQLSAQRAAAVRDILIRAGVPAGWIIIEARGESEAQAVDDDVDGMALDRRVQLRLIPAARESQVARD